MARHSLPLHSLDAFRLAALLNVTKPRQTAMKESLVSLQNSLATFLAQTDDKTIIDDAVREAITETVNFPPPANDGQALADMGYTAPTYAKLAAKLTTIVQHYKASEAVLRSEVITASTVGGCIELVIKKAGI